MRKFWINRRGQTHAESGPVKADESAENLRLAEAETDRQLAEETVTGNSITNRATLLLTTAVIFVGVSHKGEGLGGAETLSAISGLCASLFAVRTLFSGKTVGDTSLSVLDKHADKLSTYELHGKILAGKRQTLEGRRGAHKRQMCWLRLGYLSLLIAVSAVMLPVVLDLF